jgi:hypothetical protein
MALRAALAIILLAAASGLASISPNDSPQRASVAGSDFQAVTLSFELNGIDRQVIEQNGQSCEFYDIPDEGVVYERGKPILPMVSRFVIVPPQAGLELVVTASEPQRIQASLPPLRCEEEYVSGTAFVNAGGNPNLFPPVIAEMTEPSVVRGVRLVKVTTYPIQYDEATNSYLHYDHIATEIRYTDAPPVNPAFHSENRIRSDQFRKYLQALAINPDDVLRDEPGDIEQPYVGRYCVVMNAGCLRYVIPFIEWRRKAGYKVDILSLSDGDAQSDSRVKGKIQDLYDSLRDEGEEPFEYLLEIGDRSSYSYAGSPESRLESPVGTTIWGGANHADYKFGLLEGNDEYPDVAIGRWWAGSAATLGLAVGRTLAYEAKPYMDDTTWFTRGGVYSQHWGNNDVGAWHLSVNTNVRWGLEVLESLGFDDIRFYESYEWDREGTSIGPEVEEWYNDGTNILIGRAEIYYFGHGNLSGMDDNTVFPINIVASGHGEWTAEALTRNGDARHLKGPVATTCGWGWSSTAGSSAFWLGMANGFLQRGLTYGWAFCYSIVDLEKLFPNVNHYGQNFYLQSKTDYNAYGDPGLRPWIGVPRVVEAEFPESISPQNHLVTVHVTDTADDSNVAGAQVTLYAPGALPDYQHGYATYNDYYMWTHQTDEEGLARFIIPTDADLSEDTTIYVTVTSDDICPLFGDIELAEPEQAVDIEGYELTETNGNGDGSPNPGESFVLTLTAADLGSNAVEDVFATVSSLSPWVTVSGDTILFGDIDAGGAADGDSGVTVDFDPACPDGASRPATRPVLTIDFHSSDETWQSALQLTPASPNLEVEEVMGGLSVQDTVRALDIKFKNIGALGSDDVRAKLIALGMGVAVVNSEADYAGIAAGRDAQADGNPFTVTGNTIVVPGTTTRMMVVFSYGDDPIDTAYFELQTREPMESAPLGPDDYGYICFDDTDTDWDMAPEYEWIEISTREQDRDYDGTELDFRTGNPANYAGEAAVVPLGFTTQFYKHQYDSITICTNGYIAVGNQEMVVNFQNWPLDRAMGGGVGMIAPFWDNLRLEQNVSGVYYCYDEDNARFIVEWYKMAFASGGGQNRIIFEVVLYDAGVWITESGDPNILFQYKTITQVVGPADLDYNSEMYMDMPYASVGISSPEGNSGLSYSFRNTYPLPAATLQAQRALLFATSPEYKACNLYGWVTDVETGAPIEGVTVQTEHGFIDNTDGDGYWRIEGALAEVPFKIKASKLGYNDSTLTGFEVAEDDSLEIDFALLHPEFTPSTRFLEAVVDSGRAVSLDFDVYNGGNGPLDWSVRRKLPRGADVDPWVQRLSYNFGEQMRDSRIEGVAFTGGKFYVAGGDNADEQNDYVNYVYVLDRDGQLADMFVQPCSTRFGMSDLDWDGDLLWGSGGHNIYGFTTEGEPVSVWEGPNRVNQAIAWDSGRELLWIASIAGNEIIGCNRNGDQMEELNQHDLRVYGLAYWPEDPDGYNLYIFQSPDQEAELVYKMNTETGDTMFVTKLLPDSGGSPRGCYITNTYDVYSWVFLDVAENASRDRVDVWQLDARRDWFPVFEETADGWVAAEQGVVNAEERQNYRVDLITTDLAKVLFQAYLLFRHNAVGGSDTIYISLDVIGPRRPMDFSLVSPAEGDTIQTNSEVQFIWQRSLDPNFNETPKYAIWFKTGNDSVFTMVQDTTVTLDVGLLGLQIPSDTTLAWWVLAVSGLDTVASREQFTLRYRINDLNDDDATTPAVFALQGVYPTPFNSAATVRFSVDRTAPATLKVYDLQGRMVTTLYDRVAAVGWHQVGWNGSALPSGVYMVRLESLGRVQTVKTALVR